MYAIIRINIFFHTCKNIPYYTGCRRADRKIPIFDGEAGVSYEKLTVSIEHHFTQNFLIRKITRPTDKMDTKFLWHNEYGES